MSFKLKCPHCGQRLEAEDEWVDLDVQCPNCSRDFTVAKPETVAAAPVRPSPHPRSAPAAEPTRACPFCGETIQAAARQCEHCGESMDGSGARTAVRSEAARPEGQQDAHGRGKRPRKKRNLALLALSLVLVAVLYMAFGVFVIQPIGAVPEGATVLYWRFGTNMPFVASADGILLKNGQGVSLLGRVIVLAKVGELIQDRKLISLPYSRTLYLISTGGREVEG